MLVDGRKACTYRLHGLCHLVQCLTHGIIQLLGGMRLIWQVVAHMVLSIKCVSVADMP